ncbi:MAG TPA: ABC transporter substrate-binding protein [Caldilineaceae bacterium]|nr:ABC transporter substrate-binding protein [Caldilineaceae bacterium]
MRQMLWRVMAALLLPAMIVAGCAGSQGLTPIEAPAPIAQSEINTSAPPADTMLKAPEDNPKRGGILKTAWGMSPTHFDIHQGGGCAGCNMMYDGLIMWNLADGYRSIVPALAETWTVSEDQTVYTFQLRSGVKFHDGTDLTAADVVATFDRIINPGDNLSIGGIRESLAMVDAVVADGDSTVTFTLKEPTSYFLEILAGDDAVVYSDEELAANDGDLRGITAPTGSGPFRFVDYIRGEKLVLEANPDYWNPELPYVDGIELLHVAAWADRGTAVLTGQADFSWNVSVDTWEEGNSRDGIETARAACLNSHMVAINNEADGPLSDPRVRRAIHLAVDRQSLIDTFAPVWEPAFVTRWLPSASPFATPQEELLTMPGYRPEKEEDIATAKALMAEAGYPDGFETTFTAWTEAASSEVAVPAFAELLRTSLGITGDIEVIERARTADVLSSGEFALFKADTYASPILDPYPLWNTYLRTGASQNWSRYSNADFDALLDQLATETDATARQDLVNQGLDMLDENPPFFLIGFCAHSPMWQDYVKGLAIDQRLFSKWGRFETVWLDQ